MDDVLSVQSNSLAKQAYSEVREHTDAEWRDLCTATERELQSRGCLTYNATAADLLVSNNIKQTLRVKDYYRDGNLKPYQSLRWATVAGETLKNYKLIARRLCDRWQALQPQEELTARGNTRSSRPSGDHGLSEGAAQSQDGQPGTDAVSNVQPSMSTALESWAQGGERGHMHQDQKRRRTNCTYTSEVNKLESVRKLFTKTVEALVAFQYPRKQQIAMWIINTMVQQVEKRLYLSTGHSGDTYVTFFDNTIRPMKGLKHAALKLAELADREVARDNPFQWTAAQKQLPLYPVLYEVHPSTDDRLPAAPRLTQGGSMQKGADSSTPTGAEQNNTLPQQQQSPDGSEWQTIRTLKAQTEELRSRVEGLQARMVTARQELGWLQASSLPDEEMAQEALMTLMERTKQAEAIWERKRREADDAESVWKALMQEADGIKARRSEIDGALAAKAAELEQLQAALNTFETQLAAARQKVLQIF